MNKLSFILVFALIVIVIPHVVFARTTPEDIVNAKRESYEQKLKNYSPENQKRLAEAEKLIADFNKEKTD